MVKIFGHSLALTLFSIIEFLINLNVIPLNEQAVSGNNTARLKNEDITDNDLINADSLGDALLASNYSNLALLLPNQKLDKFTILHVVIGRAYQNQYCQSDYNRKSLHPAQKAVLTDESCESRYNTSYYECKVVGVLSCSLHRLKEAELLQSFWLVIPEPII